MEEILEVLSDGAGRSAPYISKKADMFIDDVHAGLRELCALNKVEAHHNGLTIYFQLKK